MIKLLADKAEMEAIEKAEKREVGNTDSGTKPMSAVSQMSAPVTSLDGDKPPEVPDSSRSECMYIQFEMHM